MFFRALLVLAVLCFFSPLVSAASFEDAKTNCQDWSELYETFQQVRASGIHEEAAINKLLDIAAENGVGVEDAMILVFVLHHAYENPMEPAKAQKVYYKECMRESGFTGA